MIVYQCMHLPIESFETSKSNLYTIVPARQEHTNEIVNMIVKDINEKKMEKSYESDSSNISIFTQNINNTIKYSQTYPNKIFSLVMILSFNGKKKTIGFVKVNRSQYIIDKGYQVPYLSDLIVDESFRKQGIANKLVEHCENICDNQWNEKYLYLWVKTHNESAIKLYYRRNYKPLHFAIGDINTVESILNGINVNQNYTLEECMNASKEYDRILFRKSFF